MGVVAVAVSVAAAGHGGKSPTASGAPSGPTARASSLGPELVAVPAAPPLAPAGAPAPGQAVDGISNQPSEQVLFHVHAHLTVFVAGRSRQIPAGIGIAPPLELQSTPRGPFATGGAGFSWLHTHAADGIIHVESPAQRRYTLGEFFDVWGQPLGSHRVGPAAGPVTAFVDGRRYPGNPRDVPLVAHAQIQLDVGRPLVAPQSIAFPPGL